MQSCKNLGGVVALLQGNFEEKNEFKANFERQKTCSFDGIPKKLIWLLAIIFNHQAYVKKS